MQVTTEMVKALRNQTGARLLDCQKALLSSNGSMDDAVVWLRKQNLAIGELVGGKPASDGMIGVCVGTNVIKVGENAAKFNPAMAAVELTANTDFVTHNAEFRGLLDELAKYAATNRISDVVALEEATVGGRTASEAVKELAGKTGENIAIRRVMYMEGDFGYYLHSDSKQFAAVEVSGADDKSPAIGKDLSMHVVFAKPAYLTRDQVPAELVSREASIAQERLKADPKMAKKPPEILEKIAAGQMGKFYSQVVLMDQPYYRENAKSVRQRLDEEGSGISVKRYVHFIVGK